MNQPYEPYPPPVYQNSAEAERQRGLRTLTHVLYALYAAYWLTGGLTVLIAIIINYLKRGDVAGTPYEAHFEWQIRTFWWAVLGHLIGGALTVRADRLSGSVGGRHLDAVSRDQRLAVSVRREANRAARLVLSSTSH